MLCTVNVNKLENMDIFWGNKKNVQMGARKDNKCQQIETNKEIGMQ